MLIANALVAVQLVTLKLIKGFHLICFESFGAEVVVFAHQHIHALVIVFIALLMDQNYQIVVID